MDITSKKMKASMMQIEENRLCKNRILASENFHTNPQNTNLLCYSVTC